MPIELVPMSAKEEQLLGQWRQVDPDPAPAGIVITCSRDGSLRYTPSKPQPFNTLDATDP
jgi:hypothetical protein